MEEPVVGSVCNPTPALSRPEGVSDEEWRRIEAVLAQDAILYSAEAARLEKEQKRLADLKASIDKEKNTVRRLSPEDENALIIFGSVPEKCAVCHEKSFGMFVERGAVCADCGQRVCSDCRLAAPAANGGVGSVCTVCSEARLLKAKSGAWFFDGAVPEAAQPLDSSQARDKGKERA